MWNNKTLTAILPAYNEEPSIVHAVEDFRNLGLFDEILVVDNNSIDGTAVLAASAGARVITEPLQGFGHALRRGMREATGDLIILCEPDGTFLARDVHKLLAYSSDFDMVMGTRTTPELLWKEANMGWMLRAGNVTVAKLLEGLHGGPSLSDCGCTFRLISRQGRDAILDRLRVGGSHFLPEMVIQALKVHLKIIEVPVNYLRRVGKSKITGTIAGTVSTAMRMMALIILKRFVS